MADEEDFETSPEKFDYNVSPSPEQTSVVDFSLAKKKSAPPNKKKNDEEGQQHIAKPYFGHCKFENHVGDPEA